ncbi:MAG: YfiR family protein [Gallionella sp.]
MGFLNINLGRAATFVYTDLARLVCLTLASGMLTTAHAEVDEYAVKAAFLYKFGLFVEWPITAFSSPDSPVNLCIVGEDPFGASLDAAVAGELINGRNIVIHRLKTVERNSPCHILYVGGSEEQSPAEIIEAVRGSNILTVTDGAISSSGVINFVIADNRVHFAIDDEAAAQHGLIISSKLMGLALNVQRRVVKEEQ